MDQKRTVIVTCESLTPEIKKVAPVGMEIREIELGLHDIPSKLNQTLRSTLPQLEKEKDWDTVLLGFGLCSEGTVGLKTSRATLVLPRVDDCIALFLGSRESYLEQFERVPGTYYFTKGWLKDGFGPLAMYNGEHNWTQKYSKEKAEWIAREMMKNYKRIAFIDTGAYDITPYETKAKETAQVFGLDYEKIPGSLGYLEQLLNGPWDRRFLVLEPGQEITRAMF